MEFRSDRGNLQDMLQVFLRNLLQKVKRVNSRIRHNVSDLGMQMAVAKYIPIP